MLHLIRNKVIKKIEIIQIIHDQKFFESIQTNPKEIPKEIRTKQIQTKEIKCIFFSQTILIKQPLVFPSKIIH